MPYRPEKSTISSDKIQIWIIACRLQLYADAFFYAVGIFIDIKTVDTNLARGFIAERFNDLEGGGFAGAVWAKQAEYFAFPNIKAYILNGCKSSLP